jgi:two-component system, OmpR family, sensor histidine kinase SenX3
VRIAYVLGLAGAALFGAALVVAMVAFVAAAGRRSGRTRPPGLLLWAGFGDASLAQPTLIALRVGVLVLDGADRPVLVNPAARQMGLVRPSPSGEEAYTMVRTLAGQVRRSSTSRDVELDLPRVAGVQGGSAEPLGVHVRASALGDGYVAVEAADVTEAHRVARVRRDFVANVSHELKTPVGALRLLAEALLEATPDGGAGDNGAGENGAGDNGAGVADSTSDGGYVPDPAAARRFAERIKIESTRLGRLVTELLELSRLQGAEPQPEPTPVAVDRIMAEVIDRTRILAASKRAEVGFAGMRGLTVYGSEGQLVTVVANLVENAIAYSAEETPITITTLWTGDIVDIAVADRGIGIEARDLDRIFERFYRVDRARSRATGGTGLGLAIVKHIATNHGGRVEVTSTAGVGSTFTLRLPGRRAEVAQPPPPSAVIEPQAPGLPPASASAAAASAVKLSDVSLAKPGYGEGI